MRVFNVPPEMGLQPREWRSIGLNSPSGEGWGMGGGGN